MATGTNKPVDVVVVGAGLSGLQAACDVQKAGLSCIVLEARDRVGGKTWTRETKNGKLVDVGAAWINDTNQSKIYELAQRFGLGLVKQSVDGGCIMQSSADDKSPFVYGDTPKFPRKEREDAIRIRDMVEELCHSIDIEDASHRKYDMMTFEDFVKEQSVSATVLESVTVWTRAMLGCEPSQLSAAYFLDYCKRGGGLLQMRSDLKNGGQYLRFKQGTQSISKALAASLEAGSVLLQTPVVKISQDNALNTVNTVVIEASNGTRYHCKKAIVSIPTPLYSTISFSPFLPDAKSSITDSTRLGFYAKSILVFKEPWWRQAGLCGLTQSFVGPASLTRDTSDDDAGQFSLTCFLVGEMGLAWSKLSKDSREKTILAQMVSIFGLKHHEDIYNVVDIVEQNWAADEWSKGAPCPVASPGVFSASGHELSKPFGDVHFVGTETGDIWKGYMDGAVRSGARGASEVIERL